jgi:hypothetical protein
MNGQGVEGRDRKRDIVQIRLIIDKKNLSRRRNNSYIAWEGVIKKIDKKRRKKMTM